GVAPAAALALADRLPDLRVLEAHRHPHKLRTGHLRGNRFRIVLRGCTPPAALLRAQAVLARLAARGLPNYYGQQRFGRDADNAARGAALVRGELRVRDRGQRRLLVSALQSELFNQVLTARLREGSERRALAGDVMTKLAS